MKEIFVIKVVGNGRRYVTSDTVEGGPVVEDFDKNFYHKKPLAFTSYGDARSAILNFTKHFYYTFTIETQLSSK